MPHFTQELSRLLKKDSTPFESDHYPKRIAMLQELYAKACTDYKALFHAFAEGPFEITICSESKTITQVVDPSVGREVAMALNNALHSRLRQLAADIVDTHKEFVAEGGENTQSVRFQQLLLTPLAELAATADGEKEKPTRKKQAPQAS
ncbi:hypothetical protein [Hymenobacter profundi]|uniref:Uncharacterized protein n=1 Tax=Hymenobacter profundi TaxID=1982110 RepID=A0ABS6X047_9BACT|nr:hypothetical protein [Hymenobacter profundi]MBW3128852.1 hypothetical protein [Hymenobacter profundi]